MLFDFATLPPPDRYRLMTSTIVPRPIAWVVTQDAAGRVNAAPFSFFNAFGEDPPVLCVGIGGLPGGGHKDSGANIRAGGEFVVNLVSEPLMEAMHVTAIDFPPGTDELAAAGLATSPSARVRPPRIADSPVAFECRRFATVECGIDRTLVVGEVLAMHVHEDLVLDVAGCRVDTLAMGLVGRVQGPGGYIRVSGGGLFQLARRRLRDFLAGS